MIQREVFSFLFRTIREFSWEKPHSAGVGVSLPRSCPRGEMPALSGIILESSQKEAAWREKFGDKFLLERVGAFCSLGSHREHSLTTWETVGGCGLWRPPRGAYSSPSAAPSLGGDLSQHQRNRSEDSGHPVGHRPGYSPIFLALTRLSYPFCRGQQGIPKVTETFPARRVGGGPVGLKQIKTDLICKVQLPP